MELTTTAKIQIYPTQEQIALLQETMQQIQNGLNYVSKYIYENKRFSQAIINKDTYYQLREFYGLRSQMAQSCIKTTIAKYKSAKSNGHDFTLVRFKNLEYDLVWNRDYSLKSDCFSINSLQGRLKIPYETKEMEKYFNGPYSFGTAKLVYKFGKYFLHIPATKIIADLPDSGISNVVGVDLGINFLAASYDSKGKTKFYNGKKIKHRRAHFKNLRKQLQQRQTASARKRLKAIGSRENRWMQDVNHCISKALVKSQPKGTMFVLEDLTGVRNATEKVKLKHRYVQVSWAFYDLRQKIEYKALGFGSKSIAVCPKYTSQTCPKCGHTEKANRNKKLHTFKCKNCFYQSNDDRIGAMNLHRKGIEYLSAVVSE